MSEIEKHDSKQEVVPFFARYLEGQTPEELFEELSEEELEGAAGGGRNITRKYPSDQADGSRRGRRVTTQKYPSDQEDGSSGGGGVTTRKYPSDQEDI
jgi:hypothetical protein